MANPLVRGWKYLMALLSGKLDEVSDPKIQIQQAIEEAQRNHQQLTQQRLAVDAGAPLKTCAQVSTFDAACRIVAANLAIAIVPRESSLPLIKAMGLKALTLTDEWATRRFVICFRDRAALTVPARLLLDTLASHWYDSERGSA